MARIIDAFFQFLDDSGDPLVDGFLEFFESGTNNTNKDTFADVGETIANTNPVQLDGAGRCPNVFGTGTYNVISFKDSIITPGTPGEQVQQFDPVGGDLSGTQFSDWSASTIYSIGDKVAGPDGIDYRSITNNNQNNVPASSPTQWEEIQLGRVWNTNVTYALNDSAYGSDGVLYASRTNSNSGNDPTTDTTNWKFGGVNPDFIVKFANAAGTVDIITAAFTPAFTALTDINLIRIKASGANTSTTPTLAVDALVAKTIVKNGNQALIAGDIFSADHELLLARNSTNDNYELLNPTSSDIDLSNLSGTGTDKIASAWVNFNGTGVVAIRDSFNVSSITDNGVGDYTINFTTALADVNYSVVGGIGGLTTGVTNAFTFNALDASTARTVSLVRVGTAFNNAATSRTVSDRDYVEVHVFGGN